MDNPFAPFLATQLRRIRGERSYRVFAAQLGISKSLAHRLENTDDGCTLGTVYKIACALGVSVEDLLGADELRKKRGRRG